MAEVAADAIKSGDAAQQASISKKFYMAVWRWHFYAGLTAIPFVLTLAVTGLLMLYANVFDWRHGVSRAIDPGQGEVVSIIDQAKAALEAVPGGALSLYVSSPSNDIASQFSISTDQGDTLVSVDPYTGQVVDIGLKNDSLFLLADDIHGSLLIGWIGDRMIEIAAGMAIILLITGLYMWFPRTADGVWSALVPRLSAKGRTFWKELHVSVGAWMSILLLIFLMTGMSWTGVWGGKFVQAWSTFPAEKWDDVPLSDKTHASLSYGPLEEVPWGLEQTALPESGSDAGRPGVPESKPVNLNTVAEMARTTLGMEDQFRIHLPSGETGVYTLSADSFDGDDPDPRTDRTVHVDQYTGNILADVGFEQYSVAAKTMAVSIAFHMGDMGLWNVILNTVFCLAVMFICISGAAMWWMRRPSKVFGLAAPPMPRDMPLWKSAVFVTLLLSLAFPLVGATLLVVLAIDLLLVSRVPALARLFS